MTKEKNQNNIDSKKSPNKIYTASNSNDINKQARIYDGKWITERGGSNPEPVETPTERPHSK